jgi:hypothetical protein
MSPDGWWMPMESEDFELALWKTLDERRLWRRLAAHWED